MRSCFVSTFALVALAAVAVSGAAFPAQAKLVEGFGTARPAGWEASGLLAEVADEPGAPSGRCLRLSLPGPEWQENSVRIPVPEGTDFTNFRSLSAWIRTTPSEDAVRIRFLALDSGGKALFQRRAAIESGPVWTRMEWPLCLWRWDNHRAADWSEVRFISIRLESKPPAVVWVDEIELEPVAGSQALPPSVSLLVDVAFAGRSQKTVSRDGFLLAADVLELPDAEVDALFAKIGKIEPFLKRMFGDAVDPVGRGAPVALLIFRDRSGFESFFRSLGTVWDVKISAPRAGGYALQDFAASFWDPAQGLRRPVFVHEIVHAVAARNLRLLPGNPSHTWLQEALANYVQLVLFPDSLPRAEYVKQFAVPVDPSGRTFFKPLETLLTGKVTMSNYAQLASLLAFLIRQRKELLPGIASGLASGAQIGSILADAGTSFGQIEKEWFEWGAASFAPDAEPPSGPGSHFETPEEWKTEDGK